MDELPAKNGPGPSDETAAADPSRGTPAVGWLEHVRARWKTWVLVTAVIAAAATLVVRRVTLSGGTKAPVAAQSEADDKKGGKGPKDPFTFGRFTVLPSETDRIEAGIKPGHWTTAALDVRANFDDFRGDVVTELVSPGGDGVDLDGLPFRLRSSRPAVLPKLQKKLLDVAIFSPVEHFSRQVALRLMSRSGRDVWNARELLTPLPGEQFFLVVLARQPDDYRYLHTLDSIWSPQGSIEDRGSQAHYRVLLPTITAAAPLPSHALFWTSTAVLLWDGLDPNLLTPAQQQALVDWLHWGGQMIVSGPDSLDLARGTFLDGFLPAAPGASWEMTGEALAPLSRMSPDAKWPLRVRQPWSGQHLILDGRDAHALAESNDHEPLVAERRVGLGRTVVTAFRLAQRDLIDWPGYDAVLNAALLRRPSRRFVKSVEDRVGVAWADGVDDDPRRVSQVRYFTRDAGRSAAKPPPADQLPWGRGLVKSQIITSSDPFNPEGGELAPNARIGPGVAAWDDASQASQIVREMLKEAAGIQVPRATFVFSLLAGYILVLVPLNWLVFRWLGRVEMAWVAAPVIAIVFGVLVVRMAQLDIGFARSATEVSVLEVQGDYPRAHLTRYWALYTSLSTEYAFDMSNPTAVALPFATGSGVQARQNRSTVILRHEPETGTSGEAPVRLAKLAVSSNSTGMVHTEEVFDLGGSIGLAPLDGGRYRVRNGTRLRLHAASVTGHNRRASLGTLEPGAEASFILSPAGGDKDGDSAGSDVAPSETASDKRTALHAHALSDLARTDTLDGEIRLVAWTAEELPGVTITPAANQTRRATVVVAHLTYGPPRPVQMDFNSRAKIAELLPADLEPAAEGIAPKPGAIDFLAPPAENRP